MRADVVGLVPHTSCPRLQRPCGDRELDANSNPPTRRPWTAEESSAGQTTAIHCQLTLALPPPISPNHHSHCPRATITISTMDDLREQVELLESSANLSTSIDDVQKAIDMLTAARAKIAAGADSVKNLAVDPANLHDQMRRRRP